MSIHSEEKELLHLTKAANLTLTVSIGSYYLERDGKYLGSFSSFEFTHGYLRGYLEALSYKNDGK